MVKPIARRRCASLVGVMAIAGLLSAPGHAAEETVWIEAEHMLGIKGGCFPDMGGNTNGSWGISGPGIAPEWSQGGESEWLSIAVGPDDDKAEATYDFEVPAAGTYQVWVRYRDWRKQTEQFQLVFDPDRLSPRNEARMKTLTFGEKPVVDEDDEVKLFWKWAFGWDSQTVELAKGPARLTLRAAFKAGAHRQVDAICLTTDKTYRPYHREKPTLAAWQVMDEFRGGKLAGLQPLAARQSTASAPAAWQLRSLNNKGFAYMWNVGPQWLDELKKTEGPKMLYPFQVEPEWKELFLKKYAGQKDVPIFSDPRIVPTLHIPYFPEALTNEAPLTKWLEANPERQWGMLLNYGEPKGVSAEATANFKKFRERFAGYVSGENLGYFNYDSAKLKERIHAAKNHREVLDAATDIYMAGNTDKYEKMFGEKWPDAYREVIPAQAVEMTSYAHKAFEWGARTVGYENSAVVPALGMRLAFMRGGAREYGRHFGTYRSCNFGDSATVFSHQGAYFGPKHVYDNSYDAWKGAGMTWYKMDIWTQYMQGSSMFYHEQGFDEFWAPAGGATPQKEIQLSPKGRLVTDFLDITRRNPDRGTPFTPIAFLVDLAHGWDPNNYQPGAFGHDAAENEKVLKYGMHERQMKEWFQLAYYPYPEKETLVNTGTNQIFIPGIMGDVFDVLATATDPAKASILDTYPVVILNGDIELSASWGQALNRYVNNGGTLLVSAGTVSGPGAAALQLPKTEASRESDGFTWALGNKAYDTPRFAFAPITGGQALATAKEGGVLAAAFAQGKGKLVYLSVPRGLGLNARAMPALSLLLLHLRAGQMPVEVAGDVQWFVNRTQNGWLVTLLNPAGADKPQQGFTVTRFEEARAATITTALPVKGAREWFTDSANPLTQAGGKVSVNITVPAGGVRIVELGM